MLCRDPGRRRIFPVNIVVLDNRRSHKASEAKNRTRPWSGVVPARSVRRDGTLRDQAIIASGWLAVAAIIGAVASGSSSLGRRRSFSPA